MVVLERPLQSKLTIQIQRIESYLCFLEAVLIVTAFTCLGAGGFCFGACPVACCTIENAVSLMSFLGSARLRFMPQA